MSYNRETNMYEGYIYIILNDIHHELVYVGQTTTTLNRRWNEHKAQMKKHSNTDCLHNAMEKYGIEHFAMDFLEMVQDENKESLIEILDQREKHYINIFNSYKNGYNATRGGRDGVDHQKRSVIKYDLDGNIVKCYESVDCLKKEFDSVSTIYDCCLGNAKYAYGYIWRYTGDNFDKFPLPTENEKEEAIIRAKALMPIDKYDYKGNKILTYKNANDAAYNENVSRKKIVACCTGRNVYCNMYIFRFYTDRFDSYATTTNKPKVVEQYDINGNFIAVYESVRQAGKILNIPHQAITGVCRGEHKTSYGYKWSFLCN